MNAVLSVDFRNTENKRTAHIGQVTFARAKDRGYSDLIARDLAKRAKAAARFWETAEDVALRMVPAMTASATTRGPQPPSAA